MTEINAFCKNCKEPLEPNHIGPCPKCGKEGKHINVEIQDYIWAGSRIDNIKDIDFEVKDFIKEDPLAELKDSI